MNVGIGFVPQNLLTPQPDAEGYFPFCIEGDAPYILEIAYDEEESDAFMSNWMDIIDQYPIYVFFEAFDFHLEDFEHDCAKHKIEYEVLPRKKHDFYGEARITNKEQFGVVLHYLYSNGNMNNFAAWSLEKDVFNLGNREFKTLFGKKKLETPIVSIPEKTTVFWIGYDGDYVIIISNDAKFSNLSSVTSTFPEGVDFSIIE